ncbi:MAG: adenylate/guanylate cyclase domain-containing protein [Lentisphaerae bacterium]|nr:adenylate/guanylate cyclase domain-containing protein [Lentisphaerota bacterium]
MSGVGLIAVEVFLLGVLLAAAWYLRKQRRQLITQRSEFKREVALLEEQNIRLEDAGMKLLQLKEKLELEQEKSARLLRNILPEQVIDDLRNRGESLPERFDNVTVLFADIVNFTEQAAELDPAELIWELNDIFSEFDQIFSKHNCVRIKTIGDAYMAVAGLDKNNSAHCVNILRAACEARNYLAERNQKSQCKYRWQMRFGVNSGSVIGGIVGREKYIYDILGDTVNTASRIEHASEAMQINVSQSSRSLAESEFEFSDRGAIEVKGKGRLEMYFLLGEKKS